jgi:hypothetical protein
LGTALTGACSAGEVTVVWAGTTNPVGSRLAGGVADASADIWAAFDVVVLDDAVEGGLALGLVVPVAGAGSAGEVVVVLGVTALCVTELRGELTGLGVLFAGVALLCVAGAGELVSVLTSAEVVGVGADSRDMLGLMPSSASRAGAVRSSSTSRRRI